MFVFKAADWIPKFILHDKNGAAIAKAIEAAMQIMNDTILQGVDCVTNVDTMPEWRLDELAWELDIPYDYAADVDVKRAWIRNAYVLARQQGTPAGVSKYLAARFGDAIIDENRNIIRDPFLFKVILPGAPTQEELDWATATIERVKNVRSNLYEYYSFIDGYTDETGKLLVDEAGPLYVEGQTLDV